MAGNPRPKSPPSGGRVPRAVVDEVMARSGGRCECSPGCMDRAEVRHHKRRRSQGGAHTADNIAHLSDRHHRYVHDNPEWAYKVGLLIRSGGAE